MTETEARFTKHPHCPSELMLDRFHLGDLEGVTAIWMSEHVAGCARCQARAAFREAGMTAFPDIDSEELLARIERRAILGPPKLPRSSRLPALSIGASLLAMCTVGLLAVNMPTSDPGPGPGRVVPAHADPREGPESVRRKGGEPSLRVFRERRGRIEELGSGEAVRPGDRLRFKIGGLLPGEDEEIMLLSLASSGARFTYYPTDGSLASRPPLLAEDGALPGAIQLDDSPEPEWLHLVACPRPFLLSGVQAKATPSEPEIPPGCRRTSFSLQKEAP